VKRFATSSRSTAIALVFAVALALAPAAAASVTYNYTGNNFTLFSCGPTFDNTATLDCGTPAPTNTFTQYTAGNHVTATLTLDSALPANMAITDIRNFAGFGLSMNDGQHTVTFAQAVGSFVEVGTDASGNINQWRLVLNTGGALNGGIDTINKGTSVLDIGVIACCDPTVSGNLALVIGNPGTWTGGSAPPPTPTQATQSLITTVSDPLLMLTVGQINSLTDKLNNVLASIAGSQNKQAINQLNAFINSVQTSVKVGKITPAAGNTLITAAQAIITQLSN